MYTIKEIADLAGVSTRTLRYYDQLGLLKPAEIGKNGYRYYDHESLLKLQQVLFFRELELPLKEIKYIFNRPDFQLLSALESHRKSLQNQASRIGKLLQTIDNTILSLEGDIEMSEKDYFDGFDESQYEDEVLELWGETPQYKESQKKWSSYTRDQKEIIEESRRITK
jgi:DNA-binding transcriptional MerR regulator